MELRLKPHDKNIFPLGGVLVKSPHVEDWVKEIQWMKLPLDLITVYAIPHTSPNTIWGCLVVFDVGKHKTDAGKNSFCQVVNLIFFIPERSIVYPAVTESEINNLLKGRKHVYHPEFGFVELEEEIMWKDMIVRPEAYEPNIQEPAAGVFIPGQIKTFQIKPLPTEEALQEFEEKHFPKREKFKDKPLNPFEKAKVQFYKMLFTKKAAGSGEEKESIGKTGLLSALESLRNLFSKKGNNWTNNLQTDYEELEKRNQKDLDKLLDLLKKDPREALKYAIPLDADGLSRGTQPGRFDMQKRWFDFSLFGDTRGGGGGMAVLHDNAYNQLHTQYWNTAQELIKQKDYKKAAFIYLKLLKNYPLAAQTLEEGGLYQEAASVYLKYCNNKPKAAECYEKGSMTMNAIDLYDELGDNEKVGDLYYSIHKKKEAFSYYLKVTDDYEQKQQYVKASLIYKNKMENEAAARETLLKGWRADRDAFNCLNNYFANISDTKQLDHELQQIYKNEVNVGNREVFLRVLQYEHDKQNELSPLIKEMAHEIIVAQIAKNPGIVTELRSFNKKDKQLVKDALRFKVGRRKGG